MFGATKLLRLRTAICCVISTAALLPGAPMVAYAAGNSKAINPVQLQGAALPALTAVVSRKTHGAIDYNLPIDRLQAIDGNVTIESRAPGAAHKIIFTFDSTVFAVGPPTIVDEANVAINNAVVTNSGNDVEVSLPGLADNKRLSISLPLINGLPSNAHASVGFLLGDVTRAGAITAASIAATKAQTGRVTDAANFQFDVNTSGVISAADVATVRARFGTRFTPMQGPAWMNFARDSQHTALSPIGSQPLTRLKWSTPVDLAPQYSGSLLFAHYGSPVITKRNTVVIPVKTGATGGTRFEARSGVNGELLWSTDTDYVFPPHGWLPSYNITLTANDRVYAPGAGGKVFYREKPDSLAGAVKTFVFYGAATYAANPAAFDATVFINTPITADAQGNIFFGFSVTGANPANLVSGFARITPDGTATYINAAAIMGWPFAKPMMNAASALSIDQGTIYVPIRASTVASGGAQTGYLVALDATTLAYKNRVQLMDPSTHNNAGVTDNSTASPMVGPDGDVYYGMLEGSGSNHFSTGWMLHFDASLSVTKTPGAFGWDNTPSVVPASMVPNYTGPSSYLLVTKYNHYVDNLNRIAILDPNQTQNDPDTGALVMKEIMTILAVTPIPNSIGFQEWCINSAVVDPATGSILANSEDGYLYRWHLATNQFSERFRLNSGVGQAYTATLIGPDGVVYAINNATLMAVGR